MYRSHRYTTLAFCVATLGLAFALYAQSGSRGRDRANAGGMQHESLGAQGLTSLYAVDPIGRTMNFTDGAYGGVIQDYMVKNANSDIDFGGYLHNAFTVGIEGGREGAIVDLGLAATLGPRYGFKETVGGGQGYASIRLIDGELHILADYENQTTQPLAEAAQLVPGRNAASVAVHAGHVYVVRIVDRHDQSFELIVKFMVVEFRAGESVTLRWHRLK